MDSYDLGQYTQGYDHKTDPEFNGGGGDFPVMTPGWYDCAIDGQPVIEESEAKKRGNRREGLLLKVNYKIISGPSAGRLIFDRFNLKNDNPQAVQISQRDLTKLGLALGLPEAPQNLKQLINQRLQVKIKVRKDDPTKNETQDYRSINQQPQPAVQQQPVQQQQMAPPPQQQMQQQPVQQPQGQMRWQQPAQQQAPVQQQQPPTQEIDPDTGLPF